MACSRRTGLETARFSRNYESLLLALHLMCTESVTVTLHSTVASQDTSILHCFKLVNDV
jgi:hypothetical protein